MESAKTSCSKEIRFKSYSVIRKIASHYYLNVSGNFEKYPIITINNGVITDISVYDVLPEIAGLEFYSGVLLPLFVDVISPKSLNETVLDSLLGTSLISKVATGCNSRICVGAKAEFILCSDLNLVKSGHVDEAKFRRLI